VNLKVTLQFPLTETDHMPFLFHSTSRRRLTNTQPKSWIDAAGWLLRPAATEGYGLADKEITFVGGKKEGEQRVFTPGSQATDGHVGEQLFEFTP
jgi:hypothetical protein